MTRLKKAIAISLLFSFLFANTEFNQLLKFPALLGHYLEHKSENKDESFTRYLSKHYTGKIAHTHHHDHDHHKLPFKSNDCTYIHLACLYMSPGNYGIAIPDAIAVSEILENNGAPHLSNFYGNIWQPPKAC